VDTHSTLILTCPDQKGLVARISYFISQLGGNIIDLDEHADKEEKMFFIRLELDMQDLGITEKEFGVQFQTLADEIQGTWEIKHSSEKAQVALFVSKMDHCLQEILWRHDGGELNGDMKLIISNHMDLKFIADRYNIPFHYFPVTKDNKSETEAAELELLEKNKIDTIVLARYMQVLSSDFVKKYPNQIINIHHSFLPAFIGANPYRRAFERGVKLIGATSHYVTEELDEGPIIEQDVMRITHKDSLKDLIRKGRHLERMVLARALYYHLNNRVLKCGKKTIIFT